MDPLLSLLVFALVVLSGGALALALDLKAVRERARWYGLVIEAHDLWRPAEAQRSSERRQEREGPGSQPSGGAPGRVLGAGAGDECDSSICPICRSRRARLASGRFAPYQDVDSSFWGLYTLEATEQRTCTGAPPDRVAPVQPTSTPSERPPEGVCLSGTPARRDGCGDE